MPPRDQAKPPWPTEPGSGDVVAYSAAAYGRGQIGAVGPNATVHMHQHQYAAPRREPLWPVMPVLAPGRVSAYQRRQADEAIPRSGSVVLSGANGFGKTQIAAGRFADSTADLRLWVPAATFESVLAGYARAAAALDLAGASVGVERLAGLFLGWLAGTDRSWLVVLDNLDHPDQLNVTYEFLGGLWPPIRPSGLTLCTTTSRDPQLRGGGRTLVDVDTYSELEAKAYLTERLNPAVATAELPADALDQAAELAADLGYHARSRSGGGVDPARRPHDHPLPHPAHPATS